MKDKVASEKIAYFSALCFFLSAVEYAIPKPVPFFRIGFANIPLMLSLAVFSKKEVFILCLSKIFFQAVISGTFFSYIFIFSFAGTLASVCAMMLVYNLVAERNLVSWIGVCAAGAFANNVMQLVLSYHFIFGEGTRLIAPWILFVSLISSVLLGFFSNSFCRKSLWWKNKLFLKESFCNQSSAAITENQNYKKKIDVVAAVISFAAVLILIFLKEILVSAFVFIIFTTLVFVKKKKIKILPSIFLILSITFFELLIPNGKIIFEFKSLKITQGALILGLNRSLRLCSFVFISKFLMSINFVMPGMFGKFFKKVMDNYASFSSVSIKFKTGHLVEKIDSVLCKNNDEIIAKSIN